MSIALKCNFMNMCLCNNCQQCYTQIKKTVNTENIPGMCVLTNHVRDLVAAENEWVLSHGIELF